MSQANFCLIKLSMQLMKLVPVPAWNRCSVLRKLRIYPTKLKKFVLLRKVQFPIKTLKMLPKLATKKKNSEPSANVCLKVGRKIVSKIEPMLMKMICSKWLLIGPGYPSTVWNPRRARNCSSLKRNYANR